MLLHSIAVGSIGEIQSCTALDSELAKLAASSSANMRALLARFVELAEPGTGSPKIFLALARLPEQPWVEGRLRVEISGNDETTTIEILSELGVGIVERLLPLTRLRVPFDEFVRAIDLAPELMLPLRATDLAGKIVLTPLLTPEEIAAAAAPTFELDDTSLGDGERITQPPAPPSGLFAAVDPNARPLVSDPPPTPIVENRPTPLVEGAMTDPPIDQRPTPMVDAEDVDIPQARPTPVVPADLSAMQEAKPRVDPRREPD